MAQVSDYNIANASGASVRSDLNAVFDAIKTLNSGGSDPSNTAAFMPYVDTGDSNNLKIRNASNNGFTTVGSVDETNLGLLPRAGGTMTGQLLGDDGSAAGSPAYAFDGDTDTGMFRSGANTIGFSTAGTTRVSISNAGLDMTNALPIRFQDSSGAPFVALKAPASVSSNVTFTLPAADGSAGEFLKTDGSGNLSFSIVQGVPSGAVFCIAVASVPSGYLECNGQSVSRTTFAALFAIIGTQYGSASGSTFNVPDLRGEFIRGFDNGRGVDSGRSIASSQSDQNDQHSHGFSMTASTRSLTGTVQKIAETFSASGTASGVFAKTSAINAAATPASTDSSPSAGFSMDASHTHSVSGSINNQGGNESRPRNIAMMYVIKI